MSVKLVVPWPLTCRDVVDHPNANVRSIHTSVGQYLVVMSLGEGLGVVHAMHEPQGWHV